MLNLKKTIEDLINHLGATRIGVWTIKTLISPLQKWVYHSSGGKFMSSVGSDRNVLLLTTKGRRTGKDRTIPVFYIRNGDSIVICNVKPEHERTNPWVLNLRSNPIAMLQIGQERAGYQARTASEIELEQLWPRLTSLWPAFETHYQRGGKRSIFILERRQTLQNNDHNHDLVANDIIIEGVI